MKIILTNDVKNLGKSGDIKDVKAGYARNYLIPFKKAMRASLENCKLYESKKDIDEAKLKMITISVKANSSGKLFGSITKKDIIKRLKELNILIKSEQIKSKVYIERIGFYEIEISFYKDLLTKLQLNIINL